MSKSRLPIALEKEKDKSEAAFQPPPPVDVLSRAFLLVSVGQENTPKEGDSFTGEKFASIANLLHKNNSVFEKLDVVIAGTLQRHNFWLFVDGLSKKNKLAELFTDLSPHIETLEELAKILAYKFYAEAKRVEEKYIIDNEELLLHIFKGTKQRALRWSEVMLNAGKNIEVIIDGLESKDDNISESSRMRDYNYYHKLLLNTYKLDKKFQTSIDDTAERYYKANIDLIITACAKISEVLPVELKKFFVDPKLLAMICSRNFVLEECPLLFPVLSKSYTSLIYPSKCTLAFKATMSLFEQDEHKLDYTMLHYTEIKFIPLKTYKKGSSDEVLLGNKRYAIPVFRRNYKTPIDENERNNVVLRFLALKAQLPKYEVELIDAKLKKHEHNIELNSLIHIILLRYQANAYACKKEFNAAIACYKDIMFINENYESYARKKINFLEKCNHTHRYVSSITETLLASIDNLIANDSYEKLINQINVSLPSYQIVLENCADSMKFLLQSYLMIAKGDDCKAQYQLFAANDCTAQYKLFEALEYYKNALILVKRQSHQERIISKRIALIGKLADETSEQRATWPVNSSNIKVAEEKQEKKPHASGNIDYIRAAFVAFEKEIFVYKFFNLIFSAPDSCQHEGWLKHVFYKDNQEIQNSLAKFYSCNNGFTGYQGMNPAHAQFLIDSAHQAIKADPFNETAIECYQYAVYILDCFMEIWEDFETEALTKKKAYALNKIKEVVEKQKSLKTSDRSQILALLENQLNQSMRIEIDKILAQCNPTMSSMFLSYILLSLCDQYIAQNNFFGMSECYKKIQQLSIRQSQQEQLMFKRIMAVELFSNVKSEDNIVSQASAQVDYVSIAIKDFKTVMRISEKFDELINDLSTEDKIYFEISHKQYISELHSAYSSFNLASYHGMTPAHAKVFQRAGDRAYVNNIQDRQASYCYQYAIDIVDRFTHVWERYDKSELVEMRKDLVKKFARAQKNADLVSSFFRIGGECRLQTINMAHFVKPLIMPIAHPILLNFFMALECREDGRLVGLESTPSRRFAIIKLVAETLQKIEDAQCLVIIPYEFYIPLYDRIYDSKFLSSRDHPNWDYYFNIKIPPLKHKLLDQISSAALKCLRLQLDIMMEDAEVKYEYERIFTRIDEAQKHPMFRLLNFQGYTLFSQPVSQAAKELDQMKLHYQAKIKKTVSAQQKESGVAGKLARAIFAPGPRSAFDYIT